MSEDNDEKYDLLEESKKVEDDVVGKGQDFIRNEVVRIDVKDEGEEGANEAQAVVRAQQLQHQPLSQPQGSVVCWERFLHLRSLKVMLVEYDDCTRHVVAALLRNCSYEVTEAANGLQAWKILEDLTNHIDLILTEVVLPCLSGIGLLRKIMSHKSRKNVPVIMMSTHDSMGLVFKCLSKGAVDFLVKPIRKNELKNLWQHVWRRCHSSSGSGSESGTQTQKSVKSKTVRTCDNHSGSNDEDDDESSGLNVGDGSDNGSDNQSSWTKHAIKVDSPQPVSPWEKIADCPDSTCAQVITSNAEMPVIVAVKCLEQERRLGSGGVGEQIDKGLDINGGTSRKMKYRAINLTGVVTNAKDSPTESTDFEVPKKLSRIPEKNDKAINCTQELASLEPSQKRLRGVQDIENTAKDVRKVLRRSGHSAFSRYDAGSSANKASSRKIGCDSPFDNSIEYEKKESICASESPSNCNLPNPSSNGGSNPPNQSSNEVSNPPNQSSNEGSNNMDMGSTTNHAFTGPFNSIPPPSAFHSVKKDIVCDTHQIGNKHHDLASMAASAQPRNQQHKETQVQHVHHHYIHHHHLPHRMQLQDLPQRHKDPSIKKMAANSPHCGSTNVMGGHYSLNGSASGSNHGSTGQNGGSKTKIDIGLGGKNRGGDACGSVSGNRIDPNKSAQREAVLTKFRQKRNQRCFGKKVRYQARKRLADQRPRLRGQFVRSEESENTDTTMDS